jgi:5-methylcytosine-specific restriction protein A
MTRRELAHSVGKRCWEGNVGIHDVLTKVHSEFSQATQQPFKQHPLAAYLRGLAAREVYDALGPTNRDLTCEGSAGAGNWAHVPWIAVFDPLVTDSATRGYYVVYLFHTSDQVIHLSLNQGTTATREEFGGEARKVLVERATFMRSRLPEFTGPGVVTEISLGANARLPGDYVAGHALGVTYQLRDLPDEGKLQADLLSVVRAYRTLTFRGGFDEVIETSDSSDDDLPATASLVEKRQYRLHKRVERNRKAARLAKEHHGTRCQACALDFEEAYGPIGVGFIEAHHLRPIGSLQEGLAVEYQVATDFAVLCSNCHRMIHKTSDPSDLPAFQNLVVRRR